MLELLLVPPDLRHSFRWDQDQASQNRVFRDTFGITASVALERLRCSRTESLLTRTDMTIAAVARQCGYADVPHFSHRFSSIHGISPSAYRGLANPSPSVLEHPGALRLSRLIWE